MHKIFVRWNAEGGDNHRVEVTLDGKVIQSHVFMNNEDRLYGYCRGIVETLNRSGISIDMPACLRGRHLSADHEKED